MYMSVCVPTQADTFTYLSIYIYAYYCISGLQSFYIYLKIYQNTYLFIYLSLLYVSFYIYLSVYVYIVCVIVCVCA